MDDIQTTAVPVPSRPMLPPLGMLFREAWTGYTAKAKTYVLIALIPALIQLVVMASGNSTAVSITMVVGVVVLIVFSILAQGALLLVATRPTENLSFGEAYRKSMSYFWIDINLVYHTYFI